METDVPTTTLRDWLEPRVGPDYRLTKVYHPNSGKFTHFLATGTVKGVHKSVTFINVQGHFREVLR